MATRSRIGLRLAYDSILSVYHHWDGYPEWLGVTLNKKFNTREKVAELIDGGDMSSCDSNDDWDRKELGETRPLYYNERGDNTEPQLHLNIDDYFDVGEEYAYVYTLDHEWECYEIDHTYDDEYNVIGTNVKSVPIPTEQEVEEQRAKISS